MHAAVEIPQISLAPTRPAACAPFRAYRATEACTTVACASHYTFRVANMSSEDDATTLMAAFKRRRTTKTGASHTTSTSAAPSSRRSTPRRSPPRASLAKKRTSIAVENLLSGSSAGEDITNAESPPKVRRLQHVRTSPVRNKSEYTYYEPQDEVERIIRERTARTGDMTYEVKLVGGHTKQVSEAASILQLGRGER